MHILGYNLAIYWWPSIGGRVLAQCCWPPNSGPTNCNWITQRQTAGLFADPSSWTKSPTGFGSNGLKITTAQFSQSREPSLQRQIDIDITMAVMEVAKRPRRPARGFASLRRKPRRLVNFMLLFGPLLLVLPLVRYMRRGGSVRLLLIFLLLRLMGRPSPQVAYLSRAPPNFTRSRIPPLLKNVDKTEAKHKLDLRGKRPFKMQREILGLVTEEWFRTLLVAHLSRRVPNISEKRSQVPTSPRWLTSSRIFKPP